MEQDLQALVIDDDAQVRELVSHLLLADGWKVSEAPSAERAFEILHERHWAVVFCDVMMGGADGYAVIRRFAEEQSDARVVLMTGHGSAVGALDATALGAYDYLLKPFTVDAILTIAHAVRAYHAQLAKHEATETANDVAAPPTYQSDIPLIGRSPAFVECLKLVGRVAATNLPALITGESGTGKEIVARAIHRRSRRTSGSFVAVNCGAIPVELIESELFGHARGAFTGAERERRGLWEEADGGTILLDEITETSQQFQVKLLRVLQQGEIRRVGSNQTLKVDVRVLAATNRDIEEEVKQNRFRQDLLYRLNAVTIHLPALRERSEDIPLLARHFAEQVRPAGAPPVHFSPATLELLQNYSWQGNIRELENAVLHAVSLCDTTIHPEHLPARVRRVDDSHNATAQNVSRAAASAASMSASELTDNFTAEPSTQGEKKWLPLAEVEAEYVARVLAHTGGNKQAAARLLHIDRKTLTRILRRDSAGSETTSQ